MPSFTTGATWASSREEVLLTGKTDHYKLDLTGDYKHLELRHLCTLSSVFNF